MGFAYPVETPTEEIGALIGMLTGKSSPSLKLAAHSGWVVQGYLQGLIIGADEHAVAKIKGLKAPKLTDAQAVKALQALVGKRNEKADLQAAGLLDDLGGGALKAGLAKLILPILMAWLKKWLAGGGLEDLITKIGSGA